MHSVGMFSEAMFALLFWLSLIAFCAFLLLGGTLLISYVVWRRLTIKEFQNKYVFVTGAAKGFGRSLCLELDRRGVHVYAGCHSESGAENLKNEASSRLKTVVIEVTDRTSVENARKVIESDLPTGQSLWALVNNAGIARGMVFDFALLEDYREVLEVNFLGVVNVTEVFLPLIKKSRGRIVNVSSIMGRCTLAAGPYSASKFALEAYNDGLRRTLRAFGVHVAVIEPGFFHTSMNNPTFWRSEIGRLWEKLPEHLQDDYGIDFKEKVSKVMSKFISSPPLSSFNDLGMVTSDMVHAIEARHPKARYVSGMDALLMYKPVSFLPDWILDFFMCSIIPYYKVTEKQRRKS